MAPVHAPLPSGSPLTTCPPTLYFPKFLKAISCSELPQSPYDRSLSLPVPPNCDPPACEVGRFLPLLCFNP